MDSQTVLIEFLLTLFAGLSTGIGSALAFFTRKTNTRFLSLSLGFSAGVMLYVSFVEILAKAKEALAKSLGEFQGDIAVLLSFFGGILFIGLIDILIPSYENPHEVRHRHDLDEIHSDHPRAENLEEMRQHFKSPKLLRLGVFTALAIAVHNFPEGLATFVAALADPALLRAWFSPQVFGVLFGSVAGIMVYISLDELLPTARAYGQGHLVIWGTVAGMAVMATSLILF
jgi:ZIP family zinc transporter